MELPRADWPPALLRRLWDELKPGITRRGRSLQHETAWLSLAGYVLRPGCGWRGDERRIDELWRLSELGLSHRKEARAHVQWWILWRRVCGGLDSGRQLWLHEQAKAAVAKQQHGMLEAYRLLGALERLPIELRIAFGRQLAKMFAAGKVDEASAWAFGRAASRVPLYGGSVAVIPPGHVEKWFAAVAELDWSRPRYSHLARAFYLAARCAEDPANDLSGEVRERIAGKLGQAGFGDDELLVLREYVPLKSADERSLFGESLPLGLRLEDE